MVGNGIRYQIAVGANGHGLHPGTLARRAGSHRDHRACLANLTAGNRTIEAARMPDTATGHLDHRATKSESDKTRQ